MGDGGYANDWGIGHNVTEDMVQRGANAMSCAFTDTMAGSALLIYFSPSDRVVGKGCCARA